MSAAYWAVQRAGSKAGNLVAYLAVLMVDWTVATRVEQWAVPMAGRWADRKAP